MDTAALAVRDDAKRLRYELTLEGDVVGFVSYRWRGDAVVLVHTEIDPAHQGQGLGTKLVQAALDDLRERGIRVVPLCPFARAYVRRHPESA